MSYRHFPAGDWDNEPDDARAQRTNIINSAQPLSDREQTALNAALFERTRAERYELAMRRALLHLGRRERLNAQLELQNALLP